MIELKEYVQKVAPLGVLGTMITKNDILAARVTMDDVIRRNMYSVSKSFTSAAVGIARREGLLSLDEKLIDIFEEDLPDEVPENLEAATVKDLLTMTLGQESAFLMGEERPYYREKNWVKMSLARPFVYKPGTTFVYNNVGPYLAGILVQRRAGCDLLHYLMPRLFEPLGIHLPSWESDPCGNTFGAAGLFLTMDELHKFGMLCLHEGYEEKRSIIPTEYLNEALCKQVEVPGSEYGYGYLFWGGPSRSFRADGKYCQYTIICREKNAVITIVSECRKPDELNAAINEYIFPQL